MMWSPDVADAALRAAGFAALFLLVAHVVGFALRDRSAAARHLGWSVALLSVVLIPLAAMGPLRLKWLPAPGVAEVEPASPVEATGPAGLAAPGYLAVESEVPTVLPSLARPDFFSPVETIPMEPDRIVKADPAVAWGPALGWSGLLIWLLGSAAWLLRLLLAVVASRRAMARAVPAVGALKARFDALAIECGVSPRARLLVSEDARQPCTTGFLHPVVIVPASPDRPATSEWAERETSSTALLHELAHVRRRDVLTQLIGHLATAMYWWNPLVWSAARAQRREAELSCDDVVLLAGTDPADYAQCLLSAARHSRGKQPALQLAMAHPIGIHARIEAVLDGCRRRSIVSVSARLMAWIGAAGLGLACAALDAAPAIAEPQHGEARLASVTLVVSPDGSADFTSIQAAVDAAPEGARIEVRPGRYEEKVRLAKTLTLAGASWESCRIVSDFGSDGVASLVIHAPADVQISGLGVTAFGTAESGSLRSGAALVIDGGKAEIDDCAVLGSPASGVLISGDSTVVLTGSLIAGAWAEGIVIQQANEGSGRVLVRDCAVRHNYHNELKIGGGAPRTRIEGCWISGAGWHGIRYDGSAPEIIGNRFFGNERSGIYASGKTAARVEGNLFLASGVSCWFENQDTIVGNTFVGNPSGGQYASSTAAVSIIGQSKPRIERNVITDWKTAVSVGKSSSDGPTNALATEWVVAENVLWENGHSMSVMSENPALDSAAGNVEVDPGFVDDAAGDFGLTEESAARAKGAGAVVVLAPASPWTLQDEEKAVATGPDSTAARRERQAKQAITQDRQMVAHATSKDWVDGALQIRDAKRREGSIAAILTALQSESAPQVEAALTAFQQVTEVAFDKAPFEEIMRKLAATLEGRPQVQAFYGLLNARRESTPGDLDLLIRELEQALEGDTDGALLGSGSHLLLSFSDREIKGRVADVVLAMFASDKIGTAEVLHGLWGARVSPEVGDYIVTLAMKGSRYRHDAIYFGLSTFYDKSPAVLDALFEACEDPDHNNSGRALWGLTYGVPEASYPKVADFLILLFEARSSASIRRDCLKGLRTYAGVEDLPRLEALAANELLGEDLRSQIEAILARLRGDGKDGK